MKSRRRFLLACSTAAAGFAVAPASLLGARVTSSANCLDRLALSHFASRLHTVFRVSGAGYSAQDKVLINAGSLAIKSAPFQDRTPMESFSLMFQGDPGQSLGQDTYQYSHETLGCFEMFIVPVGSPGRGRYEAVFSRPMRRLDIQQVKN